MTSLLIVAALVGVPGVGAALAFAAPGEASIETRLALVVGLGYALVAGLAITLALVHFLSRPSFIVGVIVVTLAVWFLALRQGSPRKHASALVAQGRESPFTLASGLVVIVAVALTWPFYAPANNLARHAPWRYWADGLEIAAANHVPATTDQWGAQVPTAVDKVVLSAFEAGVSFLVGPDPLPGMRAILTVTAIGLAAALVGLGRELGLRAFAALVPAFVLLFPGRLPVAKEVAEDLSLYKAENVGRVVALTALLVGMYAVTSRGPRVLALVAAGVFALAALTHGVSAVVAMTALVLYAFAMLLVERAKWRRTVVTGVVILVLALVGYAAMVRLSGGDLGFQRVTSGAFGDFPSDIDPTRSFDTARVVRINASNGSFFISPTKIVSTYANTTVGSGDHAALGVLALALLAATTVVVVLVAHRFLPLAFVAWGLVASFLGGAFLFSYRYHTQIPGDFGLRRLYDYAALPTALIVPATAEVFFAWLFRRRPAALAALALTAAALAAAAAVDRIPERNPYARAGVAEIGNAAEALPCDARMLPNARSAGAWEALTGRRSVIEGLAPYLRPEIMARVLPTLIGAREFFHDPRAHRAFLARENIDYIVVLKRKMLVGSLPPFPTDADAIAALPGVHEVYSSQPVTIFAVGPGQSATKESQPGRCPV